MIFVAVKYGSSMRPVVARTMGRWPARSSSAQMPAVRRSCQTMARCKRPAGGAVEGDQRLALVGDADGRHGLAGVGEAASDLGQGGAHRVPDLDRIVLDPPRAGEVLRQLPVGHVDHPGLLVDDEGPHARRSGIDGHHLAHSPEATERENLAGVGGVRWRWVAFGGGVATVPWSDPERGPKLSLIGAGGRPTVHCVSFGGWHGGSLGCGERSRANHREQPVTCADGGGLSLTRT